MATDASDTLRKAGLAAVIVLAPGGFILGATLAARYWRRRQVEKAAIALPLDEAGD